MLDHQVEVRHLEQCTHEGGGIDLPALALQPKETAAKFQRLRAGGALHVACCQAIGSI